ncbi:response regulator transcription factor [Thiocystis violascens]|uniref:Response regulator with CheY-like receiver domain and winged-helix DNA-binding domain n=1 Tax=Thiocystis violascens (strain ATCC 17096 / DSM 198 / 6111) TaxID=765911 RepID=I3YH03_THIV6|nr:response regulator transcription factor [Thiocystis violascens]AFL76271.1 response regulator with CheY-like receiver domain and winged-helix DNA-binding domain [Thiocystis violascens DSM 198]
MRILLVEDDERVAEGVNAALNAAGFVVDQTNDGEDAWFRGDTENYAAAILDLGLPGLDGLSVLRKWRAAGQRLPVLILTARGDWSERVEGIDAGADDYLPKPFRMEELIARLRALIRRAAGQASALLVHGRITLDTRRMAVSVDGTPIHLSPQEYRLVSYLMQHAGRVVSQLELTEQLYAQDFERDSNAVEVLVGRVRRKLGAELIETRRGFGYLVEPDRS